MANERWRRSSRGLFPTQHTALDRFSARGPTDGWSRLRFDALERRDLLAFAPAVSYPTGSAPHYLAAADLNFDGNIDLVGAATGSDQIMILMGTANGTFQPGTTVPVADEPFHVEIADFNADGKLDLAVPNYGSNLLSVALGNGNGTFQSRVDYAADSFPTAVDSGDLNGDGKLDLVVVSNLGQSARVMIGVGDGTFVAGTSYSIPQSFGVAVADFDGDGKLDVAASGYVTGTMSVLKGNGNGTLQPRVDYVVGPNPYSVVVADFNRDGKLDIATPAYGANYVSILIGDGSGGFPQRLDSATGARPLGLTSADYNMDGKLDLAMALAQQNPDTTYSVGVIHGNGNGTFQSQTAYTVGTNPFGITSGDFNRDGAPDLASTNEHSADVSVLLNMNAGPPVVSSINPTTAKMGETVTIVGSGFSATPANNEVWFGEVRAAVSAASSTQLMVTVPAGAVYSRIRVANAGLSGFSPSYFTPQSATAGILAAVSFASPTLTPGGHIIWSDVGDIDGDQRVDVVTSNSGNLSWRVFLNNVSQGNLTATQSFPSNSLSSPVEFSLGFTSLGGALGDLDGDGKLDVVITDYQQNSISLFRNTSSPGNVSFAARIPLAVGITPKAATISDVDNDGRVDILVANSGYVGSPTHVDNRITLYRNRSSMPGSFDFDAPIHFTVGLGPYGVTAADLNGDGKVEIIAGSEANQLVTILTNHSTGPGHVAFGNRVDISTGQLVYDVLPGDFNGDGRIDLFVSNYDAGVRVLYNNVSSGIINTGSFSSFLPLANNQASPHGKVGDLDGDADLDVLLSSDSNSNLATFANNSPVAGNPPLGFTSFALNSGQIFPGSVSIVDFDGDGRNDIVSASPNGQQISLQRNVIQSSTISSLVWRDTDADGIQDAGETGIGGAVAELFDPVDGVIGNGNDVSLGTRVTDASGNYSFDSFLPGSYYLEFRTPVGFTFTTQDAGGNDTLDSDANSSTGRTAIFVVAAGQNDTSRAAGLVGAFPGFGWARREGSSAIDSGYDITTDADGFVYTTGFAALAGGYGADDIFISKFTSVGALVWQRVIGGTTNDQGQSIAVDATGNVYVSGIFRATVDFDPGSGVANLSSTGEYDAFVMKLDSNGNLLWAKSAGGAGVDQAIGVALDALGGVIITGMYQLTVDFDPGPGTANISNASAGVDMFVWKLAASDGSFQWVRGFGGSGSGEDVGYDITTDAAGNIFVAGAYAESVDFDPGAGTTTLTAAGSSEAFVLKLTSAGSFVWAQSIGGTQYDRAYGIAVDAAGSVFATGILQGTADLNPGAGTFNVTSGGQEDVFVVKLDSSGGFLWGKLLGGVGRDISNALSVDSANNVFVAGYFESAVDFDPGAGTFLHVAQGQYDAYLWKLTSDGQLSAAMQWGLSAGDTAVGIGLDSAGTIYLTGNTNGTVDFDPGPGQFNLTTVADRDAYFWKVFAAALPTPASVSGFVWCDLDSDGVQDAGEAGIGGAVAELFNPVDGVIGNGDDVSLGTRVTDASGNYTFDNVPSGSYYLEFRTPVGFTFTTHDAGGNDALDSDANSSTGRTAIFAVAAGQNDSSRDAGLIGAFPGFGWATTQGSTLQDFGFDVVVDSGGFVYSTGATTTPPGTNSEDIVISKHTNVGALVWRKVLNGASIDQGQSIALDAAGNVFVSGIFRSTVDFDPGPGVVSLAADGSLYDAFVMKLDTEGNLLWVKSAGSTGADQSLGLAVDPSGNVIVTGMYQFTVDFDPGPGIANLTFTGPGNVDIFYWKLSGADGSLQWVKGIGGSGEDVGYDVTTDASGNVYATGSFEGSVDFDPNAGVTPLASSGSSDIFALKLTSAGSLAWAKKIGGTQFERAYGIKVDSSGNVVVSGYTDGTADLDPGAGTDNVTAAGLEDSLVVKLDSSGNYVWGRILGGTGRDMVNALALDATGNVYATGYFQSVIDFDPGAGLFPLVANGTYDAFLWKLTSTGSLANAAQWGGAGTGSGIGLAVDATHVYVTGYLDDTVDFDPGVGTFNQTTVGGWDSFVWKVNPALLTSSSVGSFVWSDLDSDGVQDAGETGTSGVVVELFHSADGIIGNGNDVSLGTQTTDVNGAYSFATVPAGSYYLRFRKPNGFIFSPLNAGGDDALDSDANYYGFTEVFTLAAGQIDTSRDAGLRAAAERIVFASDRDGDFDIYEMDTSGANVVQLINVAGADNNGSWSPDGDKLLFSSDRDGDPEVYVMNADGSGVTKLTNNMSLDSGPIWSPDGSKIAFVSQRDGNYEIYVMNADGSNQTRLTNNVAQDLAPDWSPDGSRIVFYSNRTGGGDIYVVDAVGGTPIRLTTHAAVDTTPHFSPDGAKIAFDSARDGDHEIWVMNADGSNPVQLTSNTQFDQGPRWSPDGTKLVFYRDFGVNREVFTMNADGSNQTNISNHTAADDNPAWSQKAVGTLGNFVWNDLDGDGIQDAGEPGLSGVTVSVYTQAVGGVAVATTTTNGSGQYTFSALAAQTYYVEVTLPSGYVLSPQGQGSDDALDSDFDRTSRRTGPVVLSAGQNLTSVDAGMFQPVTISGRKYHDLNGDGSDLTPSVVVLQPSAATGKDTYNIRDLGSTALHRANTNYGGSDGLAIGQGGSTGTLFRTLIEFVGLSSIPAGTEIVSARLGFTGIGGAGLAPAVVYPMQQTWTEGTQSSDEPATPDGATWQTFDGTGAWPGISGFNAENGSGFTSQSANLASPLGNGDIAGTAGVQSWINLNAQTVEDWIDGAAVNRGMLIVATNESSANSGVLMASSDHSTAAWRPALELTLETRDPGLAGWTIYLDLDNDNQLDANEPFDITDANGEYSFTDLPAGNYTIREVQQPGWVQTAPASGFHSLTLTAGAAVIGRDFGNQVGALQVTSLTPTATGFIADFNRDLNPAALNLFDEGGVLGPSDITVTGASTGAVRGSVVVDSALRRITFIATSGVLAPDTYSVAFKSGVNAFKDSQGGLLDGNRDGTTGDDYSGNFTVANPAAGAITITMPNFARGYGQSVNLPASGSTGLPVAISNAQGVKSASFTLHYNPALLTITGATAGAGISGSVSLDTSMPGMAVVSVTNSTQLSAASGAQTLVHLTASVPSGAPYGSKQILDLANLHVLDTSPVPAELPAIDDDGIHVAAYFGDANGSQSYNAPDATAAQRIIVGLDTGLASYQLADPYLIVDINGNNQVQSDDVTQIQRAIVGLSTNDIPSLPGLSPPASGGPDPIVSLPQNLAASVGETVVVPIELFVTEPTGITLAGADLAIAYDAALLELTAADVGQLLVGFGLSVNASTPGVIRLTLTGSPLDLAHAASGILASLQFTVLAGAGSSTPLNLLASSDSLRTALYDSLGRPLTLAPSPTNADDDLVDGCLQIGPAPPESLAAMVDRALAEEDDWQLAGAI